MQSMTLRKRYKIERTPSGLRKNARLKYLERKRRLRQPLHSLTK